MSLVVPYAGLELALHEEVYRPAEDTDLALQALDLLAIGPDDRVCDVGTGTGALGLAMARRGARVVAVDLNPHAVRLARANAARNGFAGQVDVLRADLLAPLRGPFDLVVFNPPYLPVQGESRSVAARAWEGGPGGIGWARLFLAALHRCLVPGGRALVVLSSLGDREGFMELAGARGFFGETVASVRLSWETLDAVKLQAAGLGFADRPAETSKSPGTMGA